MMPTLHPGQELLSFNWVYLGKKLKVGDIVVIKQDRKEMVKRIQRIDDSSGEALAKQGRHIFVVGDNQSKSIDSRHFGLISMDQIVGKIVYQGECHPDRSEGYNLYSSVSPQNDIIDCPQCNSPVIGIYGRKDAICKNCGFKLSCCGEP
ncbi:hypothetical protein A3F00_05270 [Candidatus Daviesbacteria bacterium RIFCSPHIGHO2_12_FULL_37_11]|uniref:signal peptidase I n=1 Tax=Candidatus Daviesbacteria bacterium RIFCSPHIGHO2_12_FULL_37_11 TaxID=1797777 RepID=A0A1F5KA58_9BACT|nr:MAG: hypothetical protein A2111_01700 [Candidatus Daviesbacteria bacterium GWA1_38_6]OGE17373.1 MAG: hypothetical protein A2769_00830 [Candidatus Daviesbacteria bacterium RIFCSPHIGHO2_01_FULL_37_27]OGE37789.1 MAG: hypothetical protein A3F00_05270 [Candidatus Daviesbacteria bacterium RIFCSPHIGHO2_12_FULL_37_11]